eukprot:CAMPEP_0195094882 /NCGR_PEP_ID=MMETSP0448-20130528/46510_1 /TAXON_ID=66468 /ORGANISM="Heterocapsa triquestra, Strain CCMP 448" /LENGTH=67 /DNA_ID=CAMNT_0040128981 /DNA_START=92 /DNA_END=291 /DNA_ORIENTATION=+
MEASGEASRSIVESPLLSPESLDHRGARGCEQEAPPKAQVAAAALAPGSFGHQLDEKIQDEFDAVGV